ncbi:MAG: FprA family A-type flavoprotein [Candidatus Omnitrophica bacterium]|jgi:flavorubredoxin|nr:FprA family A-type flavoprotein [Candidatus Omnitrophota bacterium]
MEITKNIYSVGVVDWNLIDFHGYETPYGSTYNAYLIIDNKITLIDTVKNSSGFFNQMIENISSIIPIEKIDYVISNHAERDHSGGVLDLMKQLPDAIFLCSPHGKDNLEKQRILPLKYKVVENMEELSIGARTLKFFHTPLVHWPDSMMTYLNEDKILFSNDGFGQHYGRSYVYVDEAGINIILKESAKYYANILTPYGSSTLKALNILKDLEIQMIAPAHGLIWRNKQDIKTIIEHYTRWANNVVGDKTLIIYDTMWGSTEILANICYQQLSLAGIKTEMFNVSKRDVSDIVTEILDSKFVIFASPILHNQILPTMGKLLVYLSGLRFLNRKAWSIGSYGWAKNSFNKFEEFIKNAAFDLVSSGFYIKFKPTEKEIEDLKKKLKEEIMPLIL